MAASDAKPVPLKNTAYRVTFPIFDADGDLVSSATGLDSEYSIDGGAFADCTSEAAEIGSSGIYYLDLTAGEMNGDTVAIIVKTSTSGAKTTPIVLYPAESADIPVNVTAVSGDTAAADNLEAYCDGSTPQPVNVTQISGDATAADNAELAFDGTGYGFTGCTIPTVTAVTTVNGLANGTITAAAVATGAFDADALAADAVDEILDEVVEGTLTLRQAIRLFLSALAGKSSGGGTATITFRDNADSKARITATVDADGNRTAVTLDAA